MMTSLVYSLHLLPSLLGPLMCSHQSYIWQQLAVQHSLDARPWVPIMATANSYLTYFGQA